MKRGGGVLMHIASLPGPFGIGVFGQEAVAFSKQLKEQGMKYWQVLPFSYPGMGDSPYQSFSAFAGNWLFIDPRDLMARGLISADEVVAAEYNVNKWRIDYDFLRNSKDQLLRTAYSRANDDLKNKVLEFVKQNKWADEVSLYQTAKDKFYQQAWWQWPDTDLRDYKKEAVDKLRDDPNYLYHAFVQYIFTDEWQNIKKQINDNGIQIIGDMPIYVSGDSADVWTQREMFKMAPKNAEAKIRKARAERYKQAEEEAKKAGTSVPSYVDNENDPIPETALVFDKAAGVPPDYFCEDGQYWGNPIYDWAKHKADNYSWWMTRIEENYKLYDIVRIDHFRAFCSYWEIPADAKTARTGEWIPGPGLEFFEVMDKKFGDRSRLIAEDLGEMTPDLVEFMKVCGLPGMKVMQFAFNPWEDSGYLPHNYIKNCVAYTGTHDNNTLLGWLWEANENERAECLKYCGFEGNNWGEGGTRSASCRAIIKTLWMSAANTVIIPIQDMLGYGGDTRINIPGTANGNWVVRFSKEDLDGIDNVWYKELNRLYRR